MKKIVFLLLFFFLDMLISEEIIINDIATTELKLRQTLKRLKEYKNFKNNQILKLNNDLKRKKKEFYKYKKNKEYEIKKLKRKLLNKTRKLKKIKQKNLNKNQNLLIKQLKEKLRLTEKKLLQKDKEIQSIKEKYYDERKINISMQNKVPIEYEHQVLTKEKDLSNAVNIAMEKVMNSSFQEESAWVEIILED